ncbi:sensor histidine kinase [Chitinophaga ginsengisegetis]|uniref:sensor histidine kinase n=1 Tax=Chitinophaga ginsengisegetis TaxID=393003 RepID=UPI000DBA173E|nr:histidine kinase [Chitinophaga ginsengisegetis]MDR6570554.1 hypothetical protein [Chitinophaga ginsengisegetis]MDR6650288.1 hypothetical protein [Chitinophaga ginsengisegetis]MDR6656593.1 hypothetical protein [Chitinophaga ginsengisegetis]
MHSARKHISQFLLLLLVWMLLVYGVSLLMATRHIPQVLWRITINDGLFGFLNFIQFYIYLKWILPPFLEKKNVVKLFSWLIPILLGFILLKYAVAKTFFPEETLHRGYRIEQGQRVEVYTTLSQYLVNGLWSGAIIIIAAFSVHLFMLWLDEDKRRAILQQKQLQAESGFLKMQLNSHFLINSLNSIYSLALTGSPEVVPANKTLTNLLAYMVNQPADIEGREPVLAEIRYLQDFVTLQRIRTGCEQGVIFNWPAQLPDKSIAPLLLVPFVENAFKHGITNRPEKPVTITLQGSEQQLVFSVHNFISGAHHDKTGGIGLDNVRKRLQLIYPGQHQLEITESKAEYFINLTVNW